MTSASTLPSYAEHLPNSGCILYVWDLVLHDTTTDDDEDIVCHRFSHEMMPNVAAGHRAAVQSFVIGRLLSWRAIADEHMCIALSWIYLSLTFWKTWSLRWFGRCESSRSNPSRNTFWAIKQCEACMQHLNRGFCRYPLRVLAM